MRNFEVDKLLLTSAAAFMIVGWLYLWVRKRTTFNDEDSDSEDELKKQEIIPISEYRNDSRKIVIISKKDDFESVLVQLENNVKMFKVLGIDCEWCTHGKKVQPVALLQLATSNGLCILIRLKQLGMEDKLPATLLNILADRSIFKVGVGVTGDVKKLINDYGILVRGIIDLRHLAMRQRSIQRHIRGGSLKELSEVVLNVEMNKSVRLKCSNWEADTLKQEQIVYAANDALIAVDLFQKIIELKQSKEFSALSQDEKWNRVAVQCKGLVDLDFKGKFTRPKQKDKRSPNSLCSKVSSKPHPKNFRTRKEPLYHNCRLEAPDGKQLCTCDTKKAEWYVRKNIGTVVSKDPFTVRLKFVPAGLPGFEREYYLQDKDNVCVVCGRGDMYMRKYVVPHEYRRHFPKKMRHHSSHDVLLFCIDCHLQSWKHDQVLRHQLAYECDANFDKNSCEYVEDHVLMRVRSAAKALLRNRSSIPNARINILEGIIKEHYGVDLVDDALLEKTSCVMTKIANKEFTGSHGKKVVMEMSKTRNGLLEFERRWRKHFVQTMEPRFLPALWSVNYKHPLLLESP